MQRSLCAVQLAVRTSHWHTAKPLNLELKSGWQPIIRGFKTPTPIQQRCIEYEVD
jgi:hypothetical protein